MGAQSSDSVSLDSGELRSVVTGSNPVSPTKCPARVTAQGGNPKNGGNLRRANLGPSRRYAAPRLRNRERSLGTRLPWRSPDKPSERLVNVVLYSMGLWPASRERCQLDRAIQAENQRVATGQNEIDDLAGSTPLPGACPL